MLPDGSRSRPTVTGTYFSVGTRKERFRVYLHSEIQNQVHPGGIDEDVVELDVI